MRPSSLVGFGLLAACSPLLDAQPQCVADQVPMTAFVRCAADLVVHDGDRVQVEGRCSVEHMGRHRMLTTSAGGATVRGSRVLLLCLADGTVIRVGTLPDSELDALDGRRAVLVGRLEASPARLPEHVSQPDPLPTLHAVESIRALP